jgi:hypothetical protein
VDLDVCGAKLGVEVVAVTANAARDCSCDVDVGAGFYTVVVPGGDDGENKMGGAEERQLLGWAVGVLRPIGQSPDSGGCHMLSEVEALQPKEGMGHAEQPRDDLQGLAGILACPNGPIGSYPRSFRVIDLGEGRGSRLVGNRQ